MISEIDIRDWEQVDFSLIEKAEYQKSEFEYPGACGYYEEFVKQILAMRKKQLHDAQRRIPAIFKKGEE